MNNEEWLAWRRGGIGSSDAPIIMKVAPWEGATPRNLWHNKLSGNSVQLENYAMTRGKELEPVARTWFENTMNVTVFPKNQTHKDMSWVRASLDGIDLENKVMVEIKCPMNKEDHLTAVGKGIPEKYWPQVQHQLLVTGLEGMYYCSFDGANGAIVEVARDNAYIETLLEEEQKFWNMVLNKEPPPLTEKDFFPMDQNDEWRSLASSWIKAKECLDWAEEKEKEIRQNMITLSKDRSSMGHGVKAHRSLVDGAIDYKKAFEDFVAQLQFAHPYLSIPLINTENYRKKSFTKWTFRATQEKA